MAIYKVEDSFVISSQHCWRPGVYADERAAKYAFRFRDESLSALQEAANKANGGLITYEALQAEAKRIRQGEQAAGDDHA